MAAEDLHTVDWLDPDRPFLVELADLMRADLHRFAGATRAIFFDAEDAERVRARLVADGYAAEVARERYAGEDDDEDHAWAVLTDAPAVAVELLVDAHDGWLDDGEMDLPVPPPLDLPAAPKRHHRAPDGGG